MTKKNLILLGFFIAKFLLQYYLIIPIYDLHRDEYLHLDQAELTQFLLVDKYNLVQ